MRPAILCHRVGLLLASAGQRPLGGRGVPPSSPENHIYPPSPLCLFQNVCKPAEELRRPPTLQEIKQQIASYNSREKNCLGMKLVSGPAHRASGPLHTPFPSRSSAVPLHSGAPPPHT